MNIDAINYAAQTKYDSSTSTVLARHLEMMKKAKEVSKTEDQNKVNRATFEALIKLNQVHATDTIKETPPTRKVEQLDNKARKIDFYFMDLITKMGE